MKIGIFVFSLLMVALFNSCDQKTSDEYISIHFDIRSCLGDEFGESLGYNPNKAKIMNVVGDFLSEKGIEWKNLSVDMTFHEAVCEACYFCPTGERIFVDIGPNSISIIEEQDLINYGLE